MKRATKSAFDSEYGFTSPGFTVDREGNLTATSFNIVQSDTVSGVFDFIITDDQANFFIENQSGNNPAITLARGRTYTFRLDLTAFALFIKRADGIANQNTGLNHSSGDVGADAQGKSDGVLSFTVPLTAEDTLFYTNEQGSVSGTISVVDPIGLFSTVEITENTASTNISTGSLVVAGGAGISQDLYIGGSLNVAGVGISRLESSTNLELSAGNKIVLQIENTKIGEITAQGLELPINNSSITSSLINSTSIGSVTPSSAVFTTARVSNHPLEQNDVTTKSYVDTNITALAIALGS